MIDPKAVEFAPYHNIPHLLYPVATDVPSGLTALNHAVDIMEQRYRDFSRQGVKDISQTSLSHVVVVIDELADLMLTSKHEAEEPIVRIAQKGRAAGVHLIVATQRPTVNVITGLIKANIPARIAFKTASMRDSMVILDKPGAERLTGKGDGFYMSPSDCGELTRFQGAYIPDEDIGKICGYWRDKNRCPIVR